MKLQFELSYCVGVKLGPHPSGSAQFEGACEENAF